MKMSVGRFIAGKLRFKGKMAVWAIAISFCIIIISVSVAEGFRREILGGLSDLGGDVQISATSLNLFDAQDPILSDEPYVREIESFPEVEEVSPVIYRYGILKGEQNIQGVLFKGEQRSDTTRWGITVPERLAKLMGLEPGDEIPAYFVGEKLKARKFRVTGICDALMDSPDRMVVNVNLRDMQNLARWNANEVSALEVKLSARGRENTDSELLAWEIEKLSGMMSLSLKARYQSLFDWLGIVDANVLAILVLMIIVAAFNMISGLLILLFRSISTIGVLKSLGMTGKQLNALFLRIGARTVATGMLAGNAAALLFCFVQDKTHLLKLDSSNYFVSFVPVGVDLPSILLADAVAFAAILLLLLIPLKFISKVDPAQTVRSL